MNPTIHLAKNPTLAGSSDVKSSIRSFVAGALVVVLVALLVAGLSSFRNWGSATGEVNRRSPPTPQDTRLDGAYLFVSDSTTITAPTPSYREITNAEWGGQLVFKNGYFSETRTLIERAYWKPGAFPNWPEGTGFDGSSGDYQIDGDKITLNYTSSFYPGRTKLGVSYEFSLTNGLLTMVEHLAPSADKGSTGKRVLVLRRLVDADRSPSIRYWRQQNELQAKSTQQIG